MSPTEPRPRARSAGTSNGLLVPGRPEAARVSPAGRSGFTLIELIVVVAIMGVLFSMTFTILISSIDFKNTAEHVMAERKVVRAVFNIVARDLQFAFQPEGRDPVTGGRKRLESFKGGERRFDMISSLPPRPDKDGKAAEFSMVGYVVTDAEEGVRVLFRRDDFYTGAFVAEGSRYQEITDQVQDIRFSYLAEDGVQKDEWKEASPPRALQLTITMAPKRRLDKNGRPIEQEPNRYVGTLAVGSWRP